MKRITQLFVFGIPLMAAGFSNLAHAASFQGLGDLSGGSTQSRGYGISPDGSVVVGYGNSASGFEASRWTRSDGMVGLGDLSGGSFSSQAYATSSSGSSIVGEGNSTSGEEAFIWTSDAGITGLGDLTGGSFASYARGVSADGATVVGRSSGASGWEAFRWTSTDGIVGLGDLAGGGFLSAAYGISADGSVIVGDGWGSSGYEAFRWTSGGGMVGLGDLAGGSFASKAYAASADGSVVVGYGTSASGQEAFRWTSDGGMVGLGDLAGGSFTSQANAVSADGSVVVGKGNDATGNVAFIWDATNGMQNLREYLIAFGIDLTGWTLEEAMGISADGTTVVGYGTNPDGDPEAWIANITPPWASAITQLDDTPLLLDFTLKGYQTDASFSIKTVDIINSIADKMGEDRPDLGTRLALHTSGADAGKAFFIDANGAPMPIYDPIDPEIFSISSSGAVLSPSEDVPGFYKKSAWFEVNFTLNLDDDTSMELSGSVVTKTSYTEATDKGVAMSKLTLSGPGRAGATKIFLLGKGKASQKK